MSWLNIESGLARVTVTWLAAVLAIDFTFGKPRPQYVPTFGSTCLVRGAATWSACRGEPDWNAAPCRVVYSHDVGVGFSYFSARPGPIDRSGCERSRLSQTLERIWFGG